MGASTIVSRSPGLAYERMREVRQSHFTQPLARKLGVQGALLVAVAGTLALAMGLGGGAGGSSSRHLASLAAAAASLVGAGVTGHACVGAYRLRYEPLTEREALALLTVEDAAAYLGIVAGGLLVAGTVVAAGVSILTGAGPAVGPVATTRAVTVGVAVGAALTLGVGRFVDGRLPGGE